MHKCLAETTRCPTRTWTRKNDDAVSILILLCESAWSLPGVWMTQTRTRRTNQQHHWKSAPNDGRSNTSMCRPYLTGWQRSSRTQLNWFASRSGTKKPTERRHHQPTRASAVTLAKPRGRSSTTTTVATALSVPRSLLTSHVEHMFPTVRATRTRGTMPGMPSGAPKTNKAKADGGDKRNSQ